MSKTRPKGVLSLLKQYVDSIDELRATGIIRSENNPLSDYAEWLVSESLGLDLCAKSTKGHDATNKDGLKFEIKARRITTSNGSRQLSALRELHGNHFDYLVGILFNRNFTVLRGAMIPWEVVVKYAVYRTHTNESSLHLRDQIWEESDVTDITDVLKQTETRL